MIKKIMPGARCGRVKVPASQSYAHRLLIGAAHTEQEQHISCEGLSKDIKATIECLKGLGARITADSSVITVSGFKPDKGEGYADLYCGESGSTLRFLIPVVGALGVNAVFHMEGKLSDRPVQVLTD